MFQIKVVPNQIVFTSKLFLIKFQAYIADILNGTLCLLLDLVCIPRKDLLAILVATVA